MLVNLRRSFLISLAFLVIFGLAYPLAGTGVSMVFFKHQAEGSLVTDGKAVVGSTLIEQDWSYQGAKWFQGRPDGSVVSCESAKGAVSCPRAASGVVVSGTQQWGPRSKALEQFVVSQATRLKAEGIVPTNDLVTNSGSLVDPDISPTDAYDQVNAVAKANHLAVSKVRALVASQVTGRELGFLGATYVDVLDLNIALANLDGGRR